MGLIAKKFPFMSRIIAAGEKKTHTHTPAPYSHNYFIRQRKRPQNTLTHKNIDINSEDSLEEKNSKIPAKNKCGMCEAKKTERTCAEWSI